MHKDTKRALRRAARRGRGAFLYGLTLVAGLAIFLACLHSCQHPEPGLPEAGGVQIETR